MESYKLALKLFVKDAPVLKGDEFVPIFHHWIQQKVVADHLTIDVADYQHVVNGPGTLLITHEANFATDRENGQLGLLYVRKQPITGANSFLERLRAVAKALLAAADRLEKDPSLGGKIQFRTDELLFRIYDRLLAPNTPETLAAVKKPLEEFITELFGKPPLSYEYHSSDQTLFEVRIKTDGSKRVGELLNKL